MEPIQNFLLKTAANYNFDRTFSSIKICADARAILKKLLIDYDDVDQKLRILAYKEGILQVEVKNSAWANIFHNISHRLIEEINKKSPQKVSRIKTVLKQEYEQT